VDMQSPSSDTDNLTGSQIMVGRDESGYWAVVVSTATLAKYPKKSKRSSTLSRKPGVCRRRGKTLRFASNTGNDCGPYAGDLKMQLLQPKNAARRKMPSALSSRDGSCKVLRRVPIGIGDPLSRQEVSQEQRCPNQQRESDRSARNNTANQYQAITLAREPENRKSNWNADEAR
jgi:hypothetical protein